MDREYRDWLKSLSKPVSDGTVDRRAPFSNEAADYLARIAVDGTLKAAFLEFGEGDPELTG